MKMTLSHDESLMIRYVGQNSDCGDDISLWELELLNGMTWQEVVATFKSLEEKCLMTGNTKKNGSLKLTSAGEKQFEMEMVGVNYTPTKRVNADNSTESSDVKTKKVVAAKFSVVFDNGEPIPYNRTTTKMFVEAGDIQLVGEPTSSQLKWIKDRFANKLVEIVL